MSVCVAFTAKVLRRLAWALALATPMTHALEITISAQYRGGVSGRFENTTPPSGLCRRYPFTCGWAETSVLPITFAKTLREDTSDVRDGFYLRAPGKRQVDVYHQETGEARQVSFFWELIHIVGMNNGAFVNNPLDSRPSGGCRPQYLRNISYGVEAYWRLTDPTAPSPCWAVSAEPLPGTRLEVPEMGAGFRLEIPPAYRLTSGIYHGSTVFTIGPGGDFDFGSNVENLSGNTLTVNFELDVQHDFHLEFPPGSERAVLEPRNGWQAWQAGGRSPQRLYRDLPFRIWSTGPFKVYKLCEHYMGDRCGIRNAASHSVPVDVALSLPGGIQHQTNGVQRVSLPSGRAQALNFESVQPTVNRPGQLHFEVARADVQGMLSHTGSTYHGQVTVVFDAEL